MCRTPRAPEAPLELVRGRYSLRISVETLARNQNLPAIRPASVCSSCTTTVLLKQFQCVRGGNEMMVEFQVLWKMCSCECPVSTIALSHTCTVSLGNVSRFIYPFSHPRNPSVRVTDTPCSRVLSSLLLHVWPIANFDNSSS